MPQSKSGEKIKVKQATSTTPVVNSEPTDIAPINPGLASLPTEKSNKPKNLGLLKIGIGLLVIVMIVALFVGRSDKNKTAKTNPAVAPAQVSITSTGFDPATVTVRVNQGVIWTNNDTADHKVNSDPYPADNTVDGFNDKQPIHKADSYAFVFNKPGTYTYHDDLNPYSFKGTVIVKQ
jgi:plastocyanin